MLHNIHFTSLQRHYILQGVSYTLITYLQNICFSMGDFTSPAKHHFCSITRHPICGNVIKKKIFFYLVVEILIPFFYQLKPFTTLFTNKTSRFLYSPPIHFEISTQVFYTARIARRDSHVECLKDLKTCLFHF